MAKHKFPRYVCGIDVGSEPSKTATIVGRRESNETFRILHCWRGEVPWRWRLWIRVLARLGFLKVVMERADAVRQNKAARISRIMPTFWRPQPAEKESADG